MKLNYTVEILNLLKNIYFWINIIKHREKNSKREITVKKKNVDVQSLSDNQLEEIKTFWGKYGCDKCVNRDFIAFYSTVSGHFDPRFVPDDFFYTKIEIHLNNAFASRYLDNKNFYDIYFNGVNMPKTVVRKMDGIYLDENYNIISKQKAVEYCVNFNQNLIIKPAIESEGGKGIKFFNKGDDKNIIYEILDDNKNLIVQEVILQNEDLACLHKSSLNTIRIMTLLHKNEIILLSGVVRMGANGNKVDNVCSGGYVCGLFPDGRLKEFAFNVKGEKLKRHPQGAEFKKCKIKDYPKCAELAKKISGRLVSCSKMPSWDFSIDREGNPVLIEVNLSYGGLDLHQMCNGPIFGDKTNEILKEII